MEKKTKRNSYKTFHLKLRGAISNAWLLTWAIRPGPITGGNRLIQYVLVKDASIAGHTEAITKTFHIAALISSRFLYVSAVHTRGNKTRVQTCQHIFLVWTKPLVLQDWTISNTAYLALVLPQAEYSVVMSILLPSLRWEKVDCTRSKYFLNTVQFSLL
jgi:hypothetical protein